MAKETIMILCAHSDDSILGAGGSLARWAKEGKKVITVIGSYGEASHWWLKEKHTIQMRVKEGQEANKVLGIKPPIFLQMRDMKLNDEIKNPRYRKMLTNLIKKYKPTKILTHSMDDVMYGHAALYKLLMETLDKIKYECDVYSFDVWNPFNIRKRAAPRLYVNITKTFKLKLNALKVFRSQKLALWQLMPAVFVRAVAFGLSGEGIFAERFYKVR